MRCSPDIFPIFNPITEACIGHKPRHVVHVEGDWHRGVQANVVRLNSRGSFDILLQQRSGLVDIGGHKYDQSLATQMIASDLLDERAALRRGLQTELQISSYESTRVPARMRIIKTYAEQPDALNRELITLYIVRVPVTADIAGANPKITRLFWLDWDDFTTFFRKYRTQFTKTAQFYFSEPYLWDYIKTASLGLLKYGDSFALPPIEPPFLHINRHNRAPITYRGDIQKILSAKAARSSSS